MPSVATQRRTVLTLIPRSFAIVSLGTPVATKIGKDILVGIIARDLNVNFQKF